jgi:hypothetical protein
MPFEIGKPKTGGRAKGVENKSRVNLKSVIQCIVENQFLTLEQDLSEMEPKDRVSFTLKLVEYILPKQREQKFNFSDLSDEEIDNIITKIKNESN